MKNTKTFRFLMPNSISTRASTNPYVRTLAFLIFTFLAAPVLAQTPAESPVYATITFANGNSITVGSNSEQVISPVEILPGETLGIQLQLPAEFINTPVGIQPLDGGLTPEELQVTQEGMAAFAFQAGNQPGLYRICLRSISSAALLQFSIPNP